MAVDQNIWTAKIKSALSLMDIFVVLLEMKQKNVSITTDQGQVFDGARLADLTYGGICVALEQVSKRRYGKIDDDLLHRLTRAVGIRAAVKRILIVSQNSDGIIPESVLPPAFPLAVMGEYAQTVHQTYHITPRQFEVITFGECVSLADVFARLYELQQRGIKIPSSHKNIDGYEPAYAAQRVIENCQEVWQAEAQSGSRRRIDNTELRTIPTDVRLAVIRILNLGHDRSIPQALADLVINFASPGERGQRELVDDATVYAPVAGRLQDKQTTRKRPGWQYVAMACAATIAMGVAGLRLYNGRRISESPNEADEPTPMSTPTMVERMKKNLTNHEQELRDTEPIQWHDLTPAQLRQVKKLLERGEKYYVPFAIELMRASNQRMTKEGRMSKSLIDAVTDLKVVAQQVRNYLDLDRVRGFTVDIDKVKAGAVMLGRMQGGDTPNNISDDVFSIYLPALAVDTLEPWILYHEAAHGYSGGGAHKGAIAYLPRDQAKFTETILRHKDYCYYITALMDTMDYILYYYQENFEANLQDAQAVAAKQAVYEKYKIKPGLESNYAEYMAQLFFETNHNSSLTPLGVTQAELTHVIEHSRIFKLANERVEHRWHEVQREAQSEQRRHSQGRVEHPK